MKKLYCPDCGAYLEGGTGDMNDCHCGWKQPQDQVQEYFDSQEPVAIMLVTDVCKRFEEYPLSTDDYEYFVEQNYGEKLQEYYYLYIQE